MKIKVTIAMFSTVAALVLFFALAGPAFTDESPSPSPSPTGSPVPAVTPSPSPASAALVRTAREWRSGAIWARRTLCRVRACFGRRAPVSLAPAPQRNASAKVWKKALRRWHHQRDDWWQKVWEGRQKMKHPGGTSSGARWKPLARWVGWPESTLPNLAYIISRESSGRERAANPSSSARGLLQLMAGWWTGAWGPRAGNPLDAEYNLRTGLWIWKHGGWSAWAL